MNKKKYFILLFLIFVIAILKITIAGKQNELDQWIGLYSYVECYPQNNGMNYCMENEITIYR